MRCTDQGNPKDAQLVINQATLLAIQTKGHYCLLDTVLYHVLCALWQCLAAMCAHPNAEGRRE